MSNWASFGRSELSLNNSTILAASSAVPELPVEIFFEEDLKPKMKRSEEVLAKIKRSEEVWGPKKSIKEALRQKCLFNNKNCC